MLVLSRRQGESFYLQLSDDVDPDMTVAELFASGPMELKLLQLKSNQARFGFVIPQAINVLREELVDLAD